jgi:hypothetical protein
VVSWASRVNAFEKRWIKSRVVWKGEKLSWDLPSTNWPVVFDEVRQSVRTTLSLLFVMEARHIGTGVLGRLKFMSCWKGDVFLE